MSVDPLERIRNFAIIAHIDHGKSTLADRLIETCRGLSERELSAQVLDSMDLERERGITIKAQTVALSYALNSNGRNEETYTLNLIDTPGHVDFSYEVSRSLSACEGSLLVVDASQGVEAQTLATVYQAIEHDHEIIPVLNKVDLPSADVDRACAQIREVIGLDTDGALTISAKTGLGIDELLSAIVHRFPAPRGIREAPLKALVIDSWYDSYLGVVVLIRVFDGILRKQARVQLVGTGVEHNIETIGMFRPRKTPCEALYPGQIGYISGSIRRVADCRVGDTMTDIGNSIEPLTGFEPSKPVVFCGLFPSDAAQFEPLRAAIERLSLNDAALHFEMETSAALGFGFRCGFLGLLHLEIVRERLSREFGLDLFTTSPTVIYEIEVNDGSKIHLHNPSDYPDVSTIQRVFEPWIRADLLTPSEYLGPVIELCQSRRGTQVDMRNTGSRAMLTYELPLGEVVFDFHDRLKSISQGYASFDYQFIDMREGNLVRLGILVNNEPVDALACIVHRSRAEQRGRRLCEVLKDMIPRHLFQVPIQAAIGGRIIARETVRALRKDVTAKCYGGDATRKRKLLDKQREGKKRMRQFGRVEIPQAAFIEALKND